MKKLLLTALMVVTMVCFLAFGASAYECDYFTIDIPAGYTVIESEDNGVAFEKGDSVYVSIDCEESEDIDFGNLTSSEQAEYDNLIKDSFSSDSIDLVDYASEFKGYDDGSSIMFYEFNYEMAGEVVYYVEGFMIYEAGIVHHFLIMADDLAYFSDVYDIIDTYVPESSASSSTSGSTANSVFKFTSANSTFAIELPADFTELATSYPLEKQWASADNTFSVAYATLPNTEGVILDGVSDAELKKITDDFVAESGGTIKNAVYAPVTVNGYAGLRIDCNLEVSGIASEMSIYMFSTEDEIHVVYTYDYSGSNGALAKEILDTVAIYDDILSKEEPQPSEPVTNPVSPTVPSTNPVVSTDPVDETEAPVADEEDSKDEDKDNEDDEDDKGGMDMTVVIIAVAAVAVVAIGAIVIIKKRN